MVILYKITRNDLGQANSTVKRKDGIKDGSQEEMCVNLGIWLPPNKEKAISCSRVFCDAKFIS